MGPYKAEMIDDGEWVVIDSIGRIIETHPNKGIARQRAIGG